MIFVDGKDRWHLSLEISSRKQKKIEWNFQYFLSNNRFICVHSCVNNHFELKTMKKCNAGKFPLTVYSMNYYSLGCFSFISMRIASDIWHTPAQRCWRNDVHSDRFESGKFNAIPNCCWFFVFFIYLLLQMIEHF